MRPLEIIVGVLAIAACLYLLTEYDAGAEWSRTDLPEAAP